jgi:hypothetical protein
MSFLTTTLTRCRPSPDTPALQPGRIRPPLPAAICAGTGVRAGRALAAAAITCITSRNFRLTCRPVAQIQRVLDISHRSVVTKEVVEAARESLVIGVM